MNLAGEVTQVLEPKDHGRGGFAIVSVQIPAHLAANENPYVVGLHADPETVKVGDKVVISLAR